MQPRQLQAQRCRSGGSASSVWPSLASFKALWKLRRREIDLVDVFKSLRLSPGEELLFKDGFELIEGSLGHVAADRILEVGFDGFLD
jgi:hypothetical protein